MSTVCQIKNFVSHHETERPFSRVVHSLSCYILRGFPEADMSPLERISLIE